MRKSLLSIVALSCIAILVTLLTSGITHALPPAQVSCSDTEVAITTLLIEPAPEASVFTVLPTVRAEIPQPLNTDEQCKITFSTEVATGEASPQLLALAYVLLKKGESPNREACEFLPGPILARVESGAGGGQLAPGFDQTTTFISILSEKQIEPHITEIVPCFSIFPQAGGQSARLRRHCLLVECETR
jgi:hypothetical protein